MSEGGRRALLALALLALPLAPRAAEWSLARFPVERFRPELKRAAEEPALLTWDDHTQRAALAVRAGSLKPMLLLSLRPEALPGFDRYRRRLQEQDASMASLAAKLMEQAAGRRLQFIGWPSVSGMKVEFGWFESETSRRLQRQGTLWVDVEPGKKVLRLLPRRVEFENKTAAWLWDWIRPRALAAIQEKVEAAKTRAAKGGRR